jgi:hypothetical protein
LQGQLGKDPICLLQIRRGVRICRKVEIRQAEIAANERGVRLAPRSRSGIGTVATGLLRT